MLLPETMDGNRGRHPGSPLFGERAGVRGTELNKYGLCRAPAAGQLHRYGLDHSFIKACPGLDLSRTETNFSCAETSTCAIMARS